MQSTTSLIDTGLMITLIGMSVVFVLLTALVGIIHAMSALCRRFAPAAAAVPGSPAGSDDAEIVSVIAAAVSLYRSRGQ
jgi:sodium pump decarboxylase gamma subunit